MQRSGQVSTPVSRREKRYKTAVHLDGYIFVAFWRENKSCKSYEVNSVTVYFSTVLFRLSLSVCDGYGSFDTLVITEYA